MNDVQQAVIAAALGGGLTGLIAATFKGISALRSGLKAEERAIVRDLGRDRRTARSDARFWASVAGGYARQLHAAGVKPNPPNPVPPSERNVTDSDGNGLSVPAVDR
jgi:hypothetical protein